MLICSVRLCRFCVRSRLLLVPVLEYKVAVDSGVMLLAKRAGIVERVVGNESVYVQKMAVLMFMNF